MGAHNAKNGDLGEVSSRPFRRRKHSSLFPRKPALKFRPMGEGCHLITRCDTVVAVLHASPVPVKSVSLCRAKLQSVPVFWRHTTQILSSLSPKTGLTAVFFSPERSSAHRGAIVIVSTTGMKGAEVKHYRILSESSLSLSLSRSASVRKHASFVRLFGMGGLAVSLDKYRALQNDHTPTSVRRNPTRFRYIPVYMLPSYTVGPPYLSVTSHVILCGSYCCGVLYPVEGLVWRNAIIVTHTPSRSRTMYRRSRVDLLLIPPKI